MDLKRVVAFTGAAVLVLLIGSSGLVGSAAGSPGRSGLTAPTLGSMTRVEAGAADETATPWEKAQQCVFADGNAVLTVQLMVDASRSLETTDPSNLRDVQLRQWVNVLLRIVGRGADVRLAMATYGTTWTPVVEWADFDADLLPVLDAVIAGLPRDEIDTDHVGALLEARSSLDEEHLRVSSAGRTTCQMLLWFTDGQYDFDSGSARYRADRGLPASTSYSPLPVVPENEKKIIEAGLDVACSDDGLVQALWGQQTFMVAVALGDRDFRLVEEMVAGSGYVDGDKSGGCDLPLYGGGVIGPPPPPDPCSVEECSASVELPGSALASGMQVDLSLVASAAIVLEGVRVTAPDGRQLELSTTQRSTAELEGVEVELTPIGDLSATLSLVVASGIGIADGWKVDALASEPDPVVRSSVDLYSDIVVIPKGPAKVIAGEASTIEATLQRRAGEALPPASSELIAVTAVVEGQTPIPMTSDERGVFVATLPAEAIAESADRLEITLRPSTSEPVRLDPVTLSVQVIWPGYPWVEFPTAVGGTVRPEVLETPGEVRIPFRVNPPESGSGCAVAEWQGMVAADGDLPRGTVEFVGLGDGCVAAGTAPLDGYVLVKVDERHRGTECGELGFSLTSSTKDGELASAQAVCLSTVRSPTWWTRAVAVLFVAAIVLLSIWTIDRTNHFRGRIPHARRLSVASVPITEIDGSVRRLGGGGLLDELAFRQEWAKRADDELELASGRIRLKTRSSFPMGSRFPSLLIFGPKTYVMGATGAVMIGIGNEVIHDGELTKPVSVPYTLDGLWLVLPPAERPMAGAPVSGAQLVVIRVLGLGEALPTVVEKIRGGLTAPRFESFMARWRGDPDRAGVGTGSAFD